MRAHLFLRGLAREHRVTLVAGSRPFPDETEAALAPVREFIEDAVLLRFRPARDPGLLWRRLRALMLGRARPCAEWAEPTAKMRSGLARLHARDFDRAHVFRLYMLPVSRAVLGDRIVPFDLDLDDWESEARRARGESAEAEAWADLERRWLPRASRVVVCSEPDALGVTRRYGLDGVEVIENAVSVPEVQAEASDVVPPQLLFVGSLGHLPNQEAVTFLVREFLPACRAQGLPPFSLVVAGGGAPGALRRLLRSEPQVIFLDQPSSVLPLYLRAKAALAPVRSGGGTRIKALEAFAQGRPLVATAAAMAGLGVESDVHYLRAETLEDWVRVVSDLLSTSARSSEVADAAFAWVRTRGAESVIAKVAALASIQAMATDSSSQGL